MTDPWSEFAAGADAAESAVYFERAPGHAGRSGYAAWFTGNEPGHSLHRLSDLQELERAAGVHLRRHPRGAVMGYLGFDAVGLIEPVLGSGPTGSPFPLGEFYLAPRIHARTTRGRPREPEPAASRPLAPPIEDSLSRPSYLRAVHRLRTAIRDGEAFQVVLAHRRTWPRPADLLAKAGRLRATERFAFFYYLRFGDRVVVGATPESVVEVDGRRARVNPIAGTIPRGPRAGRGPLHRDRKELAEHRMLVDLARNDLGRVAVPGSVHVVATERRVRYARLEHLVSRVSARLVDGTTPWDVLRATFPAGTVSGAPKIRATEWLRREERTWRGPYAGAVGCLRAGGRGDWALAIRGGFAAGNRLYTAAGAGVVYGSQPEREFDETLLKLSHVETTLVEGAA